MVTKTKDSTHSRHNSPLIAPYWQLSAGDSGDYAIGGPISGNADIVIIGGGFAGVFLAFWLARLGSFARVVLLESQGMLCSAASGRPAGMITPGVSNFAAEVDALGEKTAVGNWRSEQRSVQELDAVVKELGVDCELMFPGSVTVARDEQEFEDIERSAELLTRNDIAVELWRPRKTLNQTGFHPSEGSLFRRGSGKLHPVKLIRALARHAATEGIEFHLNTRVSKLEREEGNRILVKTSLGDIVAERVVHASNIGITNYLDSFGNIIVPTRGQVMIAKMPEGSSCKVPGGTVGGHLYWRPVLIDDTEHLLIGGLRTEVAGSEKWIRNDEHVNPVISERFRERLQMHFGFPEADAIEVHSEWTGIMGITVDGLPIVGRLPDINQYSLTGFGGHGFPMIPLLARQLAEVISGHEDEETINHQFRPTLKRLEAMVESV